MPEIARRHDYALWLQMLERVAEAHGLDIPLAVHHRGAGTLSANPLSATRDTLQMLRNEAGLSLLPALRSTALHSLTRLRRG